MANRVTISCLGPSPYSIDEDASNERAVELMIEHWKQEIEKVLPDQPDIIVLPEACDRPEIMINNPERLIQYYSYRKNQIRDVLAGIARDHNCYIAYSAHTEALDGSWRNAMQLLDRNGNLSGVYHKNYLVPNEYDKSILCGKEASLIQCDFGTVAGIICFDLNFDEMRQKVAEKKPDLILFSSLYHGGFMQKYWAYSCGAHFAGAVAGLPCTVINPLGDTIASSTNYYHDITTTVNLDCAVIHIDDNHVHFLDMKRKFGRELIIHDPGLLGPVLITSESNEFSIQDVIDEFKLETMDNYFERCRRQRWLPGHMEL